MDEHVADAVDRGASVVAGGERAAGFPTELYWQATILADVPADARVATEETFGPVAPLVAIDSLEQGDRADQRLALRPAVGHLHRRPRALAAVRRAGAHGLGQHQRVLELLGEPPSRSGRAARAPTAAWAASADRTSCSSSPSCRRSSSRRSRAQRTERISRSNVMNVVAGDRPRAIGVAVADRREQIAVLVDARRQVGAGDR